MFGNGEVVLYAYGPDADRLFEVMEPHVRGYEARPASCVLPYGTASDPEAPEREVSLWRVGIRSLPPPIVNAIRLGSA